MAEERPGGPVRRGAAGAPGERARAHGEDGDRARLSRAHWRDNLRIMALLLGVWFAVSYLLGIVFVEPLNAFRIGGFPLGFWFSQQGAIYVFMLLILVYALWMDRVDRRHGVHDGAERPPFARPPGDEDEGT